MGNGYINQIIHAKIEDVIDDLPEVDLLLIDPPYGISADSVMSKQGGRENDPGFKKSPTRQSKCAKREYADYGWDKSTIDMQLMNKLMSKAKNSIIWGGNYYPLPPSACWVVWDKNINGNFADCELAWTNLKGAVRMIKHTWNGMLREGQEKRYHPTQKPENVISFCIDLYTKVNKKKPKLVLDCFAGSGTTLKVCQKKGIDFIGVEMIKEYVEICKNRLSQGSLFSV